MSKRRVIGSRCTGDSGWFRRSTPTAVCRGSSGPPRQRVVQGGKRIKLTRVPNEKVRPRHVRAGVVPGRIGLEGFVDHQYVKPTETIPQITVGQLRCSRDDEGIAVRERSRDCRLCDPGEDRDCVRKLPALCVDERNRESRV